MELFDENTLIKELEGMVEQYNGLSPKCVIKAVEIYKRIYQICDQLDWQMPVLKQI